MHFYSFLLIVKFKLYIRAMFYIAGYNSAVCAEMSAVYSKLQVKPLFVSFVFMTVHMFNKSCDICGAELCSHCDHTDPLVSPAGGKESCSCRADPAAAPAASLTGLSQLGHNFLNAIVQQNRTNRNVRFDRSYFRTSSHCTPSFFFFCCLMWTTANCFFLPCLLHKVQVC